MILKRVSARTFVIALALLLVSSCQPPANPAIDLGQDVTQVVAVTQPSVHIDLAKLPTAPVVERVWQGVVPRNPGAPPYCFPFRDRVRGDRLFVLLGNSRVAARLKMSPCNSSQARQLP